MTVNTHSATHNPLGTNGFEFVEYTAANEEGIRALKSLFVSLGFAQVATHKSKRVWLYRQGDINFIVNAEPASQAAHFAELRGPSVCGMAFRVKDARIALSQATGNGGRVFQGNLGPMELNIPAIYGIGESTLYFVDRFGERSIYDVDFDFHSDWQERLRKADAGLVSVDHLTHNVQRGNMTKWAAFYEQIGNFREIRYFDIEGKLTGLVSKAMTSPCGLIRIPINESVDEHSQIEEFIKAYNGEGIQHIALSTDDIYKTVALLKDRGLAFMETPDTYYDAVDSRVPGHGEPMNKLRDLNVLIDGQPGNEGILLQIFTETVIGPVFFEIIQRKGNNGFGEGNFKALFESIEQDQIRRGVLSVEDGNG